MWYFWLLSCLVSAENNPCFDYPDEISEEEELESETSNDELEDNDDDKQSSESNDQAEDEFSEEDKAQLYEDEIYGDFDEDDAESFDYDSNGGHDEGEDWRWSYRWTFSGIRQVFHPWEEWRFFRCFSSYLVFFFLC